MQRITHGNVRGGSRRVARGAYDKARRSRRNVLLALFGGAAVVACAVLLFIRPGGSAKPLATLSPAFVSAGLTATQQATPAITPSPSAVPSPSPSPAPTATAFHHDRLQQAIAANPDVVGWITIPGTAIDYPVVQAKDNKYYLTHDAVKKSSAAGAIFMDYRVDRLARKGNVILYGHHMKDGSMFAGLMQYKDKKFFDSHPVIEFATAEGMETWEIFAAYITDTEFYYIQTDFTDDSQYLALIRKMQSKSLFKSDITLTAEDDVLTLSTCTYEVKDGRFVVNARRVK